MKITLSTGAVVALIGLWLGTMALALALTTDNRDFAARHIAMQRSCAL